MFLEQSTKTTELPHTEFSCLAGSGVFTHRLVCVALYFRSVTLVRHSKIRAICRAMQSQINTILNRKNLKRSKTENKRIRKKQKKQRRMHKTMYGQNDRIPPATDFDGRQRVLSAATPPSPSVSLKIKPRHGHHNAELLDVFPCHTPHHNLVALAAGVCSCWC